MAFSLNRTESPLSRVERNKINENWTKIEQGYNGIVQKVSEAAFEKVVDAAKLDWLAPVNTFADLATTYPNAVEGNAAMAKDTGIIYRFDGSQWKPIQQIDATAINEVDSRLSAEIAEVENYISPKINETNILYVGINGSDNNDGLTPSTAFLTLSKAVEIIRKSNLRGKWVIQFSEGTFNFGTTYIDELITEYPIEIIGADVGGYPNVPKTIFGGELGLSKNGIMARYGTKLFVKDIKFYGYNGTTSSGGLVMLGGSLETSNVHADSCYYGISGQGSDIKVPDGVFENCGFINGETSGGGAAIRSLMLNRHSIGIQNNGNRNNTCVFRNNAGGVYAQESSTGHVDWCTFIGNNDAVLLRVNSRANCDGSYFDSNLRDIRAEGNSNVYISKNVEFSGTSDNPLIISSGSQITSSELIEGKDFSYLSNNKIIDSKLVGRVINNTSAKDFYTLTLKAPFWHKTNTTLSPTKSIKFTIYGKINGSTSVKRIYARLGSSLITGITYSTTETGTIRVVGEIHLIADGSQFGQISSIMQGGATRLSSSSGTELMEVDTVFRLQAMVDSDESNNNVTIDYVEISVS